MNTDHRLGDSSALLVTRLMRGAVLAPMSGVTDVAFRRLAHRFGASLVVSEMVASDQLAQGDEEARLRAEGEGIAPHIVQLAGCDVRWMAEATRAAEAAGAHVIDINMGCPAKRVTGGYAGSALMRDLDHAARLVEAVVGAAQVPVTLKMRLGWDHVSLNAPELARRAEACGVSAVTVHGRTRQQFYKGVADWRAVAAVTEAVTIPVVVNGDIRDAGDARRALAESGAAAVMLGRETLGQPWLVGQVADDLAGLAPREPSAAARTDAAIEHYEALLSLYGRAVGLRHARKHLAAYADRARLRGAGLDPQERQALVTTDEPSRVVELLRRLYHQPLREAA